MNILAGDLRLARTVVSVCCARISTFRGDKVNLSDNFAGRLWIIAGLTAMLTTALAGPGSRPAMAHEATCPYCKLDVPQDTEQQDNEVALRYGRKRIEYRCVFCALAQAKSDYKGDLTILAPSDVKDKPIVISRKDDKWSVSPETALFVGEKVNHRQCNTGYRAFSTRTGFDAWVKKNHALLGDAKPLTLTQMVEIAK
jgi:hypothetical protein